MTTEYDFDDEDIRVMVETNHQPEEKWVYRSSHIPDSLRLSSIRCEKCHSPWPCPTIEELRSWKQRGR